MTTVIVGLAVAVVIILIIYFATRKGGKRPAASAASAPAAKAIKTFTTKAGIKVEVLKEGSGAKAAYGKMVKVHYTGWLTSGAKFDSSRDRGTPFQFSLGAGKVIEGWDRGVVGMQVGERRKLTIPSELGYGARGAGGKIPPNATLIFDIELVSMR